MQVEGPMQKGLLSIYTGQDSVYLRNSLGGGISGALIKCGGRQENFPFAGGLSIFSHTQATSSEISCLAQSCSPQSLTGNQIQSH